MSEDLSGVSDENRVKSQARVSRFVFKNCRKINRSATPLDRSFDGITYIERVEVMNRKRKYEV